MTLGYDTARIAGNFARAIERLNPKATNGLFDSIISIFKEKCNLEDRYYLLEGTIIAKPFCQHWDEPR